MRSTHPAPVPPQRGSQAPETAPDRMLFPARTEQVRILVPGLRGAYVSDSRHASAHWFTRCFSHCPANMYQEQRPAPPLDGALFEQSFAYRVLTDIVTVTVLRQMPKLRFTP